MSKKRVAAAVPIGPPPLVAAEAAASVGETLAKAATTPLFTRTKKERWNAQEQRWEPMERETGVNVTPAGVVAVGVVAAIGAAVGQRALRTGTAGLEEQHEWVNERSETIEPGPKTHKVGMKVWTPITETSSPPITQIGDRWVLTGRTRRRPKLRERDGIAPYGQPTVKVG